MKLQDLLEMPKNLPTLSTEDDLDNYATNKAKFKELIKSDKTEYSRYDEDRIVYTSGKKFFCIDLDRNELTYYMTYDTSFCNALGSFLWQSLVWRSKHVEYNKTLPHEIFFATLLPKFGVIATDGDQTSDGRRFWSYQVKYAQDHRLFTYYYNLQTKDLIEFKTMLEFDKLIRREDIWGDSNNHRNKLIVISEQQLPKGTA